VPERSFATEIWTADAWFQELSWDLRYLYIYLKTNAHCNQAGLYHITLATLAFETTLPKENLPTLLKSLSPRVEWYPEINVVWVKDFLREQSKSSKFTIAAIKALDAYQLPDEIRNDFEAYNEELLHGVTPSDHISPTKRECVIIRDNFQCQYCGREITSAADYEVDHIIPVARGGKENYLNLVTACYACNRKKLDKTPQEAGLPMPSAKSFHGAQATYILRTKPTIREKWLRLFPDRFKVVESMLINIDQRCPMLVSDTHARAVSNANANASADTGSGGKDSLFSGDLFSLEELQLVLSELPAGIDKLAQHEAIKQRLADFGKSKGYVSRSEYNVRGSRIDLCWLTQQGEIVAGFEIDYRTPRVNSLEKLRRIGCKYAYILLRKGGLRFLPVEQEIPCSRAEAEETLCGGDSEEVIRRKFAGGPELSADDLAIISVWCSVKGFKMSPADASALVARLRTEFLGLDLLAESKTWAARKLTEPLQPTSRPSQQIWNWMRLAVKFSEERREREQGKGQRVKGHPREAYRGKW